MSNTRDLWFCAEGEHDGRPVLIRGRQNVLEMVGPESYPQLLRITWSYEDSDKSGLPSSRLAAIMAEFEDVVIDALERDQLGIFFCIYTHNGIREWSAYVSHVQETCDRINSALAGRPIYPIELAVGDDPQWEEYSNLLRETGMSQG